MKRILVLTSGGDSSGMNAYIKALAKLCKKNNIELIASKRGFQGLVEKDIDALNYDEMGEIQNLGGSVIKTSRSKDFITPQGFEKALETIKEQEVCCVVVVGGNGSFRGAYDLHNAGIDVLAIPGTIDNDLGYTQKTLGYDTACQNALDAIIKIKQSMQTCGRGTIVEVMGRHCADIATFSAILSNADLLITQKITFEEILEKIKDLTQNGIECPVIVARENLLNIIELQKYLEEKTNREFRATVLGYIQRGGEPTASDKLFAIQLACATMEKILKNKLNLAIGSRAGEIVFERIEDAVKDDKSSSASLLELYKQYCE